MNALQNTKGVIDVASNVTADTNTISVRIRPGEADVESIADAVEEALESDPWNRAPVTVHIERRR